METDVLPPSERHWHRVRWIACRGDPLFSRLKNADYSGDSSRDGRAAQGVRAAEPRLAAAQWLSGREAFTATDGRRRLPEIITLHGLNSWCKSFSVNVQHAATRNVCLFGNLLLKLWQQRQPLDASLIFLKFPVTRMLSSAMNLNAMRTIFRTEVGSCNWFRWLSLVKFQWSFLHPAKPIGSLLVWFVSFPLQLVVFYDPPGKPRSVRTHQQSRAYTPRVPSRESTSSPWHSNLKDRVSKHSHFRHWSADITTEKNEICIIGLYDFCVDKGEDHTKVARCLAPVRCHSYPWRSVVPDAYG